MLGATGILGRRTLAWGRRHLPDVHWVGGNRRGSAGAKAVDLHDTPKLRRELEGFDLLINAVGPYDYDPAPIFRASASISAARCRWAMVIKETRR